jgi:hypothetical protein
VDNIRTGEVLMDATVVDMFVVYLNLVVLELVDNFQTSEVLMSMGLMIERDRQLMVLVVIVDMEMMIAKDMQLMVLVVIVDMEMVIVKDK